MNPVASALMTYAAAYRKACHAKDVADDALMKRAKAEEEKQDAWRAVRELVNTGKIQPGVYRVGVAHHDEGILVDAHHDYPDVKPMFDANRDY